MKPEQICICSPVGIGIKTIIFLITVQILLLNYICLTFPWKFRVLKYR